MQAKCIKESAFVKSFAPENCKNKYAIFFAVSDYYTFAAANVIMSLKNNSAEALHKCDIIIYSDYISEENKYCLREIYPYIIFREIAYPESWSEIISFYENKKYSVHAKYMFVNLLGFQLIDEYETIVWLDADTFILGDISELFEIDEAIAWRDGLAFNMNEVFAPVLKDSSDEIHCGNGGLFVLSSRLKEYNIDTNDILKAFETVKILKRTTLNESILAWLVYSKQIKLKVLDDKVYNTPARRVMPNTKIAHFLPSWDVETKPWKNLAAYLWFNEWRDNYLTWINMGGTGPIHYTKEDYYSLFAFDQARKLDKMKAENKSLNIEITKYKEQNSKLKKKINKEKSKYESLVNSKAWKLVKPVIDMYHKVKGIING